MQIKENSWIAKLAAKKLKSDQMAITIGQTIYLYNVSKNYFLSQSKWVKHEQQHIQQFKKYGFFKFLIMYLYESWKKGYYNNKWEIEAREAENK
ncbi:DUF4157 domain-containing protein [Rhizosphaericola mali]|uniref:DUF4157 domain-containing protein n=1 Tax=Rhizosphaericola mali TaxID=2545455 RepID=UPI001CD927B6|nr:DUF4157 domain-containing protein [Rhizosphaericola mali]